MFSHPDGFARLVSSVLVDAFFHPPNKCGGWYSPCGFATNIELFFILLCFFFEPWYHRCASSSQRDFFFVFFPSPTTVPRFYVVLMPGRPFPPDPFTLLPWSLHPSILFPFLAKLRQLHFLRLVPSSFGYFLCLISTVPPCVPFLVIIEPTSVPVAYRFGE